MQTEALDTARLSKLNELIHDIRIAMMTTIESNGSLRSRPMATQNVPFDGTLWFFTDDDTAKADEVKSHGEVNICYVDSKNQRYVSLSGVGVVSHDKEKMRELWNPVLTTWFPKGMSDSRLALIKVQVNQAEYWDASANRMVQLFALAKAVVTGQRPENLGEHKKMGLPSPEDFAFSKDETKQR
ncbi:MAG TPA: pyridoxamine 5'-phosphate oxidase family protein [Opitutaceae bacterium]|nr:pyridoxamine 5'-phosphate oxidase family protein [Opitutaceae bacterium]